MPDGRSDRAARREAEADTRLLRDALREHQRHAAARLRVLRQWALDDAAFAARAGDATRAAMKTARAERLARVLARLDAGERA